MDIDISVAGWMSIVSHLMDWMGPLPDHNIKRQTPSSAEWRSLHFGSKLATEIEPLFQSMYQKGVTL